jgi:hypothetical protein
MLGTAVARGRKRVMAERSGDRSSGLDRTCERALKRCFHQFSRHHAHSRSTRAASRLFCTGISPDIPMHTRRIPYALSSRQSNGVSPQPEPSFVGSGPQGGVLRPKPFHASFSRSFRNFSTRLSKTSLDIGGLGSIHTSIQRAPPVMIMLGALS